MATVNLPSYIEDPNYRYVMPKVKCKVEGSGNGIKTNCSNTKEICLALKRNPEYLTKWFGCELCVQARYFSDEGKAILQGVHTEDSLTKAVDRFIEKYVLCQKCSLPEIDIFVSGKKSITSKCNACGHEGDLDSTHRVAATIFKNPPEGNATVGGQNKGKSKRGEKDVPEKKIKKKKKKETDGEKKRVKVKKVKAFKMNSSSADKAIVQLGIASFSNLEDGSRQTPDKFNLELRALQIAEGFGQAERIHCAISSLLMNPDTLRSFAAVEKEIEDDEEIEDDKDKKLVIDLTPLPNDFASKFEAIIGKVCEGDAVDAEHVIAGFQTSVHRFCTPESINSVYPLILKKLYDLDLFEADDVLSYYELDTRCDLGFEFVKTAVKPLLKWFESVANSSSEESYSENSYEPSLEGGTKTLN